MATNNPPFTTSSLTALRHYSKEDVFGRHDSALLALVRGIQEHIDSDVMLYADLPGIQANDNPISTIPENTLVTSARPDIVLMGEDELTLIELTIPPQLHGESF